MKVGSLFSGIGGLDLGLERAGMTIAWHSEIDLYACKVLAKHWPGVPNHGDIKNIDWQTIEPVDVICGGYPCQPFSTAGKRRGTNDPRHLWPWVRDAISALRPRYAILENVRGHLTMGGLTVISELAEIGYDAEWRVVSAAGLGAPHRRDRLVIVAYPNSSNATDGRKRKALPSQNSSRGNDRGGSGRNFRKIGVGSTRQSTSIVANADNAGSGTLRHRTNENGSPEVQRRQVFPLVGVSGCSAFKYARQWEVEPDVGRVADGVSARVDRLRGLGNAVVPQVAEYIGRLVMAHAQHN